MRPLRILLVLSLALASSGCAIASRETIGPTEPVTVVETLPPAPPTAEPTVTPRGATTVEGRLVDRGPGVISVEVVDVMTGQEAVDAAHEDGALPPEEDSLPNDVYVRDIGVREQRDVAADATTELIDCAAGCELVGFDTAAFLAGEIDPPYGGENPVLELDLDERGVVTAIREVYLP